MSNFKTRFEYLCKLVVVVAVVPVLFVQCGEMMQENDIDRKSRVELRFPLEVVATMLLCAPPSPLRLLAMVRKSNPQYNSFPILSSAQPAVPDSPRLFMKATASRFYVLPMSPMGHGLSGLRDAQKSSFCFPGLPPGFVVLFDVLPTLLWPSGQRGI